MGRVTSRYRVVRMADGVASARPDSLAAEEPLEIRVAGRPLTVTMRTPGNDFDLARGFLVSEDGVLEIETYGVGLAGDGLGKHRRTRPGHEEHAASEPYWHWH